MLCPNLPGQKNCGKRGQHPERDANGIYPRAEGEARRDGKGLPGILRPGHSGRIEEARRPPLKRPPLGKYAPRLDCFRLPNLPYSARLSDVTRILKAVEQGEASIADQLLPLVYEELRRIAAHKMAGESSGHTLQPTALVHEAWMRLIGSDQQGWKNRAHFFAAAAEAMRRILVESARRKQSLKRGGGAERVDVN